MKKNLSALLFFALSVAQLHAQIQKGELKQGKILESEISPNEKHRYGIDLEKNQFVILKVMQKGVDLMITTYDANGKKLEDFDSPNGKNGTEIITMRSGDIGKYSIEIYPFDGNQPNGNYDVVLEKIKPIATTTNGKVDELFAVWDNNYSPGAAVAIAKNGEIIYKKGYGIANLEYDIPITPTSVFHIASVSKQFTVFSILLLEQQGKLSLDDDIREYIPEVPDFGKKITLRHLATHTSGLREQWEILGLAGWRSDDVITKEHILKMVARQKELNFNPGDEFSYCNTGFTLLAEVVARVSGKSFAQFTKQSIFDPLQMKSTLFFDDNEATVKNRAYSYHSTADGFRKSNLNYANVGATSLFTTVEDLSRWAANFQTVKIGNQAIIDKMNTPAVLNNGTTFGGALGQFIDKYKGLNEIQHGGADAGYRSYLTRFPDQKIDIMVLSNLAEFNASKIAHQIADIYLESQFEKTAVAETKPAEKPNTSIAIDRKILGTYVGGYQIEPGVLLNVTENNGTLSGQVTGQAAFAFTALSDTEFEIPQFGAKLTFVPQADGSVSAVRLKQGGNEKEAPRVKPFDKSTITLSDYEGHFYSDELSTDYELKVVEGKLMVKHYRISDFELTPADATDKFTANGHEFAFVRDGNNRVTGFKVSTGRVRNLSFKKIN
jgi:CubicO group peptidase (beta-lactamase class C family)